MNGAPSGPRAEHRFLPEIQALRALAVGLVVAFHLRPAGPFSGGYVGVDVFFVISGFLITAHLIREASESGTVRLREFYARRARRLLPASLATLAVSAVLTYFFMPLTTWATTASEIVASAFYVQNLWLTQQAVSYSASNNLASPVQHFWSLSAEEQFYLVWPALIIAGFALSRRSRHRRSETATPPQVVLTLVLVVALSLAFSVWFTSTSPASAYFLTLTRAWEFGIGALCVSLLERWVPNGGVAVALRWGGLAAVLIAAAALTQATPFPGWVAGLPVLGAAAVILAGQTGSRDPSNYLVNNPVIQWLGNISYSVYLWHWPLIAVGPYIVHGDLRTWHKVVIVAVTLALAHLSRRYVEDLTRLSPRLVRSAGRTLVAAACTMLLVSLIAGGLVAVQHTREDQILQASHSGLCIGASALEHRDVCPAATTQPPVSPIVPADAPWAVDPTCVDLKEPDRHLRCDFSHGSGGKVVVAVGDSHIEAYIAPLYAIAKERSWDLHVMITMGCSPNYTAVVAFDGKSRDPGPCLRKSHEATERVRLAKPQLILTSGFARVLRYDPPGEGADGYRRVFEDWTAVAPVVVLDDAPTLGLTLPDCLAKAGDEVQRCSAPRAIATRPSALSEAAKSMAGKGVTFIDVADEFCDDQRCYGVVGGVPVYFDRDHLNRRYAVSLLPFLDSRIKG